MAGREECVLNVGETLLFGAVQLEDALEGRAGLRRRRDLSPGGDQRDAADQLRTVAGKAAHDAVAVGVAHEMGRPVGQMLDGPRHVIREVVQRQAVHGRRAAADAAVVHAGGPVAGGLEAVHQRSEVLGAAPQGGD